MKQRVSKHIFSHKLTTEAAASLLPPYNIPANTPMTVAVPQLTVPGSLGEPWLRKL